MRNLAQQFAEYTPPQASEVVWQEAPVTDTPKRVDFRQVLVVGIAVLVTALVMRLLDTGVPFTEQADEKAVIFGETTSVWPSCWPDECEGDFATFDVSQVNALAVENERHCIGGLASKWLEPVEYPLAEGHVVLVVKTVCTKGSSYEVR
jgi:hypothetical protein